MGNFVHHCKLIVAAALIWALPAQAQDAQSVETMLLELANPETSNWQQLERRIRTEWSRSGSAAMDLLLQRGNRAMEAEDFGAALEHFTALTDHAPDFAEGWHARATALFRLELYGPALDDIGRALALNPQHFAALAGLGVMFEQLGMGEEALDVYRLLSEIHPHRPETIEALDRLEKAFGGVPI